MQLIYFNKEEIDNFTILKFELPNSLQPNDLQNIDPPNVNGIKGIILSGRGPIWLYCYLTHYYHPTLFIATYDPRLGGAVIVESHNNNWKVGEVIEITID
jgi:CRISPR-associated protein Csx3